MENLRKHSLSFKKAGHNIKYGSIASSFTCIGEERPNTAIFLFDRKSLASFLFRRQSVNICPTVL